MDRRVEIGAKCLGNNTCEFIVWAPLAERMSLRITGPARKEIPMSREESGYWRTTAEGAGMGCRYQYIINGSLTRPDPASNYQPDGVHEPSQAVDHGAFSWNDRSWKGIPLEKYIMYELHVGAFTPEGTFDAVIPRLDALEDLGITAVEIMPVAQFPGARNWGYDGTYPYAVQNSYGGPDALKRLADACHVKGLAVILDVVYNHLGPEGNYLPDFGPYLSSRYRTPWGSAINYDGEYSDGVRNFFIQNALYWLENYHIDGLRLDAVHGIVDMSAVHILSELAERVEAFSKSKGRDYFLIAESDLNDSRIVRRRKEGGYQIHAQWLDDFHHAVHALITGERAGYYQDFGLPRHLGKALEEGFVYSGQYSGYRKRMHGNSSGDIPAERFIAFIQNHDQVGNRMNGERLSALAGFEALKLAAGTLIVAPYIPLIFMGEEYADDSPFLYFISHGDPGLVEAVRQGRKREFEAAGGRGDPPEPQDPETMSSSRLAWEKREDGAHGALLSYYRNLISLRKGTAALNQLRRDRMRVRCSDKDELFFITRSHGNSRILCVLNYSDRELTDRAGGPREEWVKIADSADDRWMGPGYTAPERIRGVKHIDIRPYNFLLYRGGGKK
jgi:maltooligosyltrehalose trehalohydrolase